MKLFFSISILCIFIGINISAQDKCTLVGWALYDGVITGGGSETPINVNTIEELITEAGANATKPKVIYVAGVTMGNGEAVRIRSNKTIIGLPGATIKGNIETHADTNIIVRNLILQGPGASDDGGNPDVLNLTGGKRIWIDHCDIRDGFDGNFDIKSQANYIAVTWCKFSYGPLSANRAHRFSNLIGSNDSDITDRGTLKVTFQYNWWAENIIERMPRVRFGQVHVVNNLFTSEGSNYCVRGGFEADILVEANAFINVANPVDIYNNNAKVTFIDNLTVGCADSSYGVSFTPPYELDIVPANQVRALVSDPDNGAGATLKNTNDCGTFDVLKYKVFATANNGTISPSITDSLFPSGSVATISAVPNEGFLFAGWEGDVNSTNETIDITMDGDKIISAKFIADKTSVNSIQNSLSSIYPNPVKEKLHIENIGPIKSIEIFNSIGLRVFQTTTKTTSVDISNLEAGIYIISATNDFKQVFKTSFVKE